jgi:phosphopantothenoylcysteine decarboxylase/phosphopantothenate--cysteine ligase
MNLYKKHILLGVTGGIAAYKSAELLRQLQRGGAQVRVIMTESATRFITPLTFQALSGKPVAIKDDGAFDDAGMDHIAYARWADMILVAPATANFLAKTAQGMADDLLSATCLAHDKKLVLAPAMNRVMWSNPATKQNIEILKSRNIELLGPASGDQACGEIGEGRMLEPNEIVAACETMFSRGKLSGLRILITAGPTREPIDPVRFITNRSSGKMGFALADAAQALGAYVTVVCGPTHCTENEYVDYIHIETADQMHAQVMQQLNTIDIFISAAAVADYRPVEVSAQKLKKSDASMQIALTRTADIIKECKRRKDDLFCVGFAAETENVIKNARNKLTKKALDMIIANQVGLPDRGFDSDHNAVEVLWRGGQQSLQLAPKTSIAKDLLVLIHQHYCQRHNKSNVRFIQKKQS